MEYKSNQDIVVLDENASMGALKVIAYIAIQPDRYVKFQKIQEDTGLNERSLYRHIRYLKEKGYLQTVKKECSYVYFTSEEVRENSKEMLERIYNFLWKEKAKKE